ncbi:IclR family transcriptional regulator [Methylibium rhizosphaerae]|jgi:DNA-binding IclR family transcriptional regulator|uniref:IclR family transcriptional regulator n=1 Tax=Methylibium rhizosphaerae TaxID=2570323 RepID=UPI0011290BD4
MVWAPCPLVRFALNTQDIERYRAPALDKGLDILELLAEQPLGLTRAEIVRAMGRSQSEIYRMLERLVARDYVTRSPEGDRYALSLKLFVLGSRHPPVERLVARALPLMDGFCKAAEQSCHLCIHDRGNLTVVAQVNSPSTWGMSLRLGARVSLLDTGSGHVLLAFQTELRRAEMVREHEPIEGESHIDPIELASLLDKVRASGGWQGKSRQAEGVIDLSLPILGPHDEAVAVMTCPYVRRIDRHIGPDVASTREMLREVTTTLSFR